jgi:hypothetical protein
MTQDELKQLFTICQKTGGLLRPNGNRAGRTTSTGHRQIQINKKLYLEHRLVWLWYHGHLPTKNIDHRNGIRDDNQITNLREATYSENQQNLAKFKNNTSGFTGVSFHKPTGKWQALIQINGKKYHLGLYDTPEEAHDAYLKAKSELHTFNPVPR